MTHGNTIALNPPVYTSFRIVFNWRIFWTLIFFSILSLIVVCIFELNSYTQNLYLIQTYEKQLKQLTNEEKALEINFSKADSLDNVASFVQNSAFEKTGKVEYIRVLESTALAK